VILAMKIEPDWSFADLTIQTSAVHVTPREEVAICN